MPISLYVVLGAITVLSILVARRLAAGRGRKSLPWMVTAALFGPFPLIALALLRKRRSA